MKQNLVQYVTTTIINYFEFRTINDNTYTKGITLNKKGKERSPYRKSSKFSGTRVIVGIKCSRIYTTLLSNYALLLRRRAVGIGRELMANYHE